MRMMEREKEGKGREKRLEFVRGEGCNGSEEEEQEETQETGGGNGLLRSRRRRILEPAEEKKKKKTVANGYEDSIWRDNLSSLPSAAAAPSQRKEEIEEEEEGGNGGFLPLFSLPLSSDCAPTFKTVGKERERGKGASIDRARK